MALSQVMYEKLERLFNPRGVAVIGATNSPERVGYAMLESLLVGGFAGEVYPIHPRHSEVLGRKVFRDLSEVPGPVDLALVALNQNAAPRAVRACGEHGVPGAVCVAGGFKEMGETGLELEAQLADAAREYELALIGPNTLGIFNADANLNLTFYPETLPPGSGISIVTQSGGVGRSFLQELIDEEVGISKWIGVGNRAVLDFADFVDYLGQDEATKVIVLFIEGTDRGRELMEAAGRLRGHKPILVLRAGRSKEAQKAAVTHTGNMIQSPKLFSDACRQYGLIEVQSHEELVSAAKALALSSIPKGEGIGVLTHTAGPSIIIMDELLRRGFKLAEFSSATMIQLEEVLLGTSVVIKNPVDAAAVGYSPQGYACVADIVLADPNVDLLISINSLHKHWRYPVERIIEGRGTFDKPIVVCFITTKSGAKEAREQFHRAGIPCFTSMERAALGAANLLEYAKLRNNV